MDPETAVPVPPVAKDNLEPMAKDNLEPMAKDNLEPMAKDNLDPNATPSQTHLCSQCMREVQSAEPRTALKLSGRFVLMSAAALLCILIFALVVAHLAIGERPNVITVFVPIWSDVTAAVVLVLLYVGRRHSHHRLGRTLTQIRVLCALGVSWLLVLHALTTTQTSPNICHRYWNHNRDTNRACRGLFTAAHVFAWVLTITLFSAAYATYRRAVAIHGTAVVPVPEPVVVPAWRLSGVGENEGGIKI
ncbi:hypothetical protein B0H12DRAFT_140932 [Mycena haematopus]|nr:hypothetical protein B0H12DRAFT_140932 [Mycena haematopus]